MTNRISDAALRTQEKEQLIADLKSQIENLRSQNRDYRGVNEQINEMEERFRIMTEEKQKAEQAHRQRIEKIQDETAESRRKLAELKFTLEEKQKQNKDMTEEQQRSKQQLDEKHFEANRLKTEAGDKLEQVAKLRQQITKTEQEIDRIKAQRSDMFSEITRLKEMNESKSLDQKDQSSNLKLELGSYSAKVAETQGMINAKSQELKAKQETLTETEIELARVKESNARLESENQALEKENERLVDENQELAREAAELEKHNASVLQQIEEYEIKVHEKEHELYKCRRDVEGQRLMNSQTKQNLEELQIEKEALKSNAPVELSEEIKAEVDKLMLTDEVLINQLQRRVRVYGLKEKSLEDIMKAQL